MLNKDEAVTEEPGKEVMGQWEDGQRAAKEAEGKNR